MSVGKAPRPARGPDDQQRRAAPCLTDSSARSWLSAASVSRPPGRRPSAGEKPLPCGATRSEAVGRGSRAPRGCPETRQGGPMAGPGRIYRRGLIYYIACRWDGREYRESARSAHVAAAERLLATRLAERQGHARSRALTFDALAAWYLDDYAVRRLRTLNTARGRVANLRAVFTGWPATAITSEAVRTYQRTRRAAGAAAVNRETSALSRMLQLAVRGGQLAQRPVFPERLEENGPRQGFFEHAEYLAVRQHLPPPYRLWADRLARRCPPRYGRRRRCRGYRRDSEGSRARHVVDTPPALCGPRHVAAPASGDRHRRAVESLGGPDRGAPVLAPLARRPRAGRGPHLFPSAAGRCPGRGLLRRPGDADGRRDRVGRLAILGRHAPPGLAEAPRRLAQLAAATAGWSGAELAARCVGQRGWWPSRARWRRPSPPGRSGCSVAMSRSPSPPRDRPARRRETAGGSRLDARSH